MACIVVTGLLQFNTSFKTEYTIPICLAILRCEILRYSISAFDNSPGWQKMEINSKEYYVTSIRFTQFSKDRHYRLVIMKEKSNDLQADLFLAITAFIAVS